MSNIDSFFRIESQQFLEKIIPKSDKSGAAMRAAPLGVLPTIDEVLEKAHVQAAVTHDTPDGIHAAMAAALMTHYFIYDLGAKQHLGQFLAEHVPGDWAIPWQGKVKAQGWMSVRAGITAVETHDNLSDMLRGCVDYSGDVDTVATIALAAASCSKEVENNLPQHLILSLENGTYGREYITRLDRELMALVKSDE